MQEEQPVVDQQTLGGLEIGRVVAMSNMLEHAERIDAIEPAAQAPIILQQDFHGQPSATLGGRSGLILRNGHARDAHAIPLGRKLRSAAPTAADIEHVHARPQSQLATDEIELGFLGLFQRLRMQPVGAAVDHAFVEHARVQIVADVVMLAADREGSRGCLGIQEPGTERSPYLTEAGKALLEAGAKDTEQHLIQSFALPLTVHVRLAHTE